MTTTSAVPATAAGAAPRRRRPFRVGRLIKSIVLFVIGVLMIAPLVWMISTSLTDRSTPSTCRPPGCRSRSACRTSATWWI